MAPFAGLVGPPTEAMLFAQMHLNGGELEGVRILSAKSAALMQEMQLSTGGSPLGFGLGWHVVDEDGHPYVEHRGDAPGGENLMRLYPQDGIAIVFMGNAVGYDREGVGDAAANVVFSMAGRG
jgi:hypothetical protein